MRIALFSDTYLPQVNGVARTLARLVDHATARGHQIATVAPRRTDASADGRPTLSIEPPSLPVPFYPELRMALPLDRGSARRLETFAPAIVHVATEFTIGWSGVRWAADRGVPVVTSFHTDFPAYLAGYGLRGLEVPLWQYLRTFHGRAYATFCPSAATREQLRAQGFHDRLHIWSRGVDARLFSPARRSAALRARLAPDADRVLLYVGRLAPEKRVDVLLDAFRVIRERATSRTALVVVGDGPAASTLRRDAPPDTHFTGFLSGAALADAYAAGDVFVFPSDTETFGNVVLEAMASGLPVVAPASGGVTESVRADETGLLVPPRDADAFAAATLRLLEDGSLRRRLAARARSFALRRSWTTILDGLLDGYTQAIDEARPATDSTRVA